LDVVVVEMDGWMDCWEGGRGNDAGELYERALSIIDDEDPMAAEVIDRLID
jgi:hypothetical protein